MAAPPAACARCIRRSVQSPYGYFKVRTPYRLYSVECTHTAHSTQLTGHSTQESRGVRPNTQTHRRRLMGRGTTQAPRLRSPPFVRE
eukprot:822345-Prymnesium_polylepis.2